MDPNVIARYADGRQLTTFVVEILTTPAKLWTPYPTGLTIAAKTYLYRDVVVAGGGSSAESVTRRSLTLVIANGDLVANDLVNNYATTRRKSVVVTKVHFNEDGTLAGTEAWLNGEVSRPRFVGEKVQIVCVARMGRSGPSPKTRMRQALATHTPPTDEIEFP